MSPPERLSIRARLRISIVALVTVIVLALSALHIHAVAGEALGDVGARARMLADQVNAYLLELTNRRAAELPEGSLADRKAFWYEAVRTDPSLRRLLQRTLVQDSAVVDLAVVDENHRVLASADATRVGKAEDAARVWRDWQQHGVVWRLIDLYRSNRDIVIESPIGFAGSDEPIMAVRVSLSPVLLRSVVEPTLFDLAAVSVVALAFSVILAVIASKLVGDSFDRLGEKIDLIAQGDLKSVQKDRFVAPDLVNLESKLWWLGRQYSGAMSDITNLRTNVEGMLRRLEQAILVFGSDGRLQMAGEAAERLLARSREDLIGKSLTEVFPPYTALGAAIDDALAKRKPLREQPVVFDRPNLPSVRLNLTVELIEYKDQNGTGVLVALRDAETRQQIQEGLDTARRLSAISRITSGVAHEIKNPLNAMMLHLEIAKSKAASKADTTHELDVVKQELLRLDRVVKALLDFNRPFDVTMTECDLVQLAAEVAVLIRPQAESRGVDLQTDSQLEFAPVLADADLIKQAILNVAVNGIEASPAGASLCIRVEEGVGEYILAIEDCGPGIPAEIQDKIFNLYFTTKKTGTGVGLAMTYRIMQLHSGSIRLDSTPGAGACFRLGLPRRTPGKAAA